MAKVYYQLVKSGKWTIEQVPAMWRDAVQAMLDAESKPQGE